MNMTEFPERLITKAEEEYNVYRDREDADGYLAPLPAFRGNNIPPDYEETRRKDDFRNWRNKGEGKDWLHNKLQWELQQKNRLIGTLRANLLLSRARDDAAQRTYAPGGEGYKEQMEKLYQEVATNQARTRRALEIDGGRKSRKHKSRKHKSRKR